MIFEAKLPKELHSFAPTDPIVVTVTAESESDHTALLCLMNATEVPGLISAIFNELAVGVFDSMAAKKRQ